MNNHTPPQNLEAEESVIGAMLLSPRAVEEAGEMLTPGDFYRESHAVIFHTILEMAQRNDPIDPITLTDQLDRTKRLTKAGGRARITELAALTNMTTNIRHYAGIVANEASRRALIQAGQKIVRDAGAGGNAEDLIAEAEGHLSAATVLRQQHNASPITTDLPEYLEELRQAYSSGVEMFGLRTGFDKLDETLLGLWPGQLVLVAARPSIGKSAFALNVAENFADRGDALLFNSLEMSKRELLIRSVSRAARIDGKRLQTGRIEESHANKLKHAIKLVTERGEKMFVDDNGMMTMPELRAIATRLQRTEGIKLLVVDYIQLMQGVGENRTEEIGSISRGLKQLAQQLQIPVLALSQMNRAIETSSPRLPNLSDLRGSGSLEQDSDVVIFLHDKAAYDPGAEAMGEIEVIIAKNRKGETGAVKLLFLRRYSTFQTPSIRPTGADE